MPLRFQLLTNTLGWAAAVGECQGSCEPWDCACSTSHGAGDSSPQLPLGVTCMAVSYLELPSVSCLGDNCPHLFCMPATPCVRPSELFPIKGSPPASGIFQDRDSECTENAPSVSVPQELSRGQQTTATLSFSWHFSPHMCAGGSLSCYDLGFQTLQASNITKNLLIRYVETNFQAAMTCKTVPLIAL